MNLVEKLMTINPEDMKTVETKEITLPGLTKKLGEPFTVTIRAIDGERYMEFATALLDKNGNRDFSRVFDVQTLTICEGVVEPDLKSKDLQKHFGCATPKDLVKVLFKGKDLSILADAITELSGYGEDSEGELKN